MTPNMKLCQIIKMPDLKKKNKSSTFPIIERGVDANILLKKNITIIRICFRKLNNNL